MMTREQNQTAVRVLNQNLPSCGRDQPGRQRKESDRNRYGPARFRSGHAQLDTLEPGGLDPPTKPSGLACPPESSAWACGKLPYPMRVASECKLPWVPE